MYRTRIQTRTPPNFLQILTVSIFHCQYKKQKNEKVNFNCACTPDNRFTLTWGK